MEPTNFQQKNQATGPLRKGITRALLISVLLLSKLSVILAIVGWIIIPAYQHFQPLLGLPGISVDMPVLGFGKGSEPTIEGLSTQQSIEKLPPVMRNTATIGVVNTPREQQTLEPTLVSTLTTISIPTEVNILQICSPIEGIEVVEIKLIISQEFNVPNPSTDFGHHGLDLGSYSFQGRYLYDIPVQAVFSGKIVGIINDRPPLGNAIILETSYANLPESLVISLGIQPEESIYHLYAHLLNPPYQTIGTMVDCGEEINRIGKSRTVEAHLHLETRIGLSGFSFDSMAFYDTAVTEEEQKEYLWWRTSGDFRPFDPMTLFGRDPE